MIVAAVNGDALAAFAVLLAITLAVTVWAARRTRTAADFLAAGRRISGAQNGIAISGDFMSAATFLGVTGLIFLVGIEGWTVACAAVVAILLMLLLFAERMRNTGEYTVADALSYRLREGPARAGAAAATLFVGLIFLVSQLVGAGILLGALAGTSFTLSVLITGAFMLLYVVFGGMLATTWVQIIKAGLLLACGIGLTAWALGKVGFDPTALITGAADRHPAGRAILGPGLAGTSGLNVVSGALAFTLGSAALPHILVRFFTVPDAAAARRSMGWAIALIGGFFVLLCLLGFATRYVLATGPLALVATKSGGNLAVPLMAEVLGGGPGTAGGDLLLAVVSAVAFATILAVVSGLVVSASGAVAHDLWTQIVRRGRASDRRGGTRGPRGRRDRRGHRDRAVDPRGVGVQRRVPRRARPVGVGRGEPPGAAARLHVAALQHGGRRGGRDGRARGVADVHRAQPRRVARARRRRVAARADEPDDRRRPARLPRVLGGDDARRPPRAHGARLRRDALPLADRLRGTVRAVHDKRRTPTRGPRPCRPT